MLKAAVLLSFIGSASAFAPAPNDPPQDPLNITLSSGDVVQGYARAQDARGHNVRPYQYTGPLYAWVVKACRPRGD